VTAITGSVGKTTTKELLRTLLSRSFAVSAAPKSFNNRLGVALTLLQADRSTRQVVAEMGTSVPGELSHLSRLVRPQRVVITAIERAHLSGFGDLDGVVAAKAEILDGLKPDGLVYLKAGIHGFGTFAARAPGRLRTFGFEEGEVAVSGCRREASSPARGGPSGYRFAIHGEELFLPVLGRHNVLNAAAAVAAARARGLAWEEIRAALLDAKLPPSRLELGTEGGVDFLDDSYNANPGSMGSALEAWDELKPEALGKRVVVLGDMLELGEQSRALHEELGRRLASSRVDLLVTIGSESRFVAQALGGESCRQAAPAPEAAHFAAALEALPFLKDRLRPGDQVLLKASNRVGLNELASELRRWARAASGSDAAAT
jgi:UDP-N-acetylmuramoyl-tripeptide--D-alanyl-D-alanine ligase